MRSPRRIVGTVALLVALLLPGFARATGSICAINELTGEGYVFDEDDYRGPAWHPVRERTCNDFDSYLQNHGYVMTRNPYRVEWMVGGIVLGSVLAVLLVWTTARSFGRYRHDPTSRPPRPPVAL